MRHALSTIHRPSYPWLIASILAFGVSVAATATATAGDLSVELRTDLAPQVDFVAVRTRVEATGADPLSRTAFRPVFRGDEPDLIAGVQVAFLTNLPTPRDLELTLDLLDADGRIAARRQVFLDFRDDFGVVVSISQPSITANQAVFLDEDRDGDGVVSIGDVVRYLTAIAGSDVSDFTQPIDDSLELIVGSVRTDRGIVFEGNRPGDERIFVTFSPPLQTDEAAFLEFRALVAPRILMQGVARSVISGTNLPAPIDSRRTDDPGFPGPLDPTLTEVRAPGFEQCMEELATCSEDLADAGTALNECREGTKACIAERNELARALDALLADEDADGVPDVRDACAATPEGSEVDRDGCSVDQFCEGRTGASPLACHFADWHDDATVPWLAMDCRRLRGGRCVAR